MFTLETLPFDICILLLQSLPDRFALTNLTVASRVFCRIWRYHRASISQYILFNEASRFKEEAFLVAALDDRFINGTWMRAELDAVYADYAGSLQTASGPDPWYYSEVINGDGRMISKVATYHSAILKHCRYIVERSMDPKEDSTDQSREPAPETLEIQPATESEQSRIIQSLYRVLLLLRIYCVQISGEVTIQQNIYNQGNSIMGKEGKDVFRYLELWDFWEAQLLRHVSSLIWDNFIDIVYNNTDFLDHHQSGGSQEYPLYQADFIIQLAITKVFLDYPNETIGWVRGDSSSSDLVIEMQRIRSRIQDESFKQRLNGCKTFCSLPYHYFRNLTALARTSGSQVYDRVTPKRICKAGTENYVAHGDRGKREWIDGYYKNGNYQNGVGSSDLSVYFWDDWRLEARGYRFPIFDDGKAALGNR